MKVGGTSDIMSTSNVRAASLAEPGWHLAVTDVVAFLH